MITMLFLFGLLLAVALSGFFSGSETGVYCLNRLRLRVADAEKRRGADRLAAMMRRPEDIVITMLLGTNVADYLATAFASALLLHAAAAPNLAEIYATLIVTPLILVFGGIVPKDLFRREADRLMYRLALPIEITLRAARTTGLVWLLRNLTHVLTNWIDPTSRRFGQDTLPRARTVRLLKEGAAWGGLTPLQRDLMDRVMKISDTAVARVMIPLTRVASVPKDISRADLLRIIRMAHFSRMPVYEGTPENIVGIINVYDVLTDPDKRGVEAHIRSAFRLTPGTSVSGALLQMQRAREAMAVVTEPGGRAAGILTVKDLAVEIIGDIEVW